MRNLTVSFLCGLLFALGLGVSGMTMPVKVTGFLDVTGDWDPSLALVMGGAVVVNAAFYWFTRRRRAPFFASSFSMPSVKIIDAKLVIGAMLFGVGWGLSGICPGPAFTALAGFGSSFLLFAGGLLVGMGAHAVWERMSAAPKHSVPM